jgi:hypothetical protein
MDEPLKLRWWNVDQAFAPDLTSQDEDRWPVPSGSSHKAAIWDTLSPSITLGGDNLSSVVMELNASPVRHARISLPPHGTGSQWSTTFEGQRLIAAINSAGACVLAPAVWTIQCERILGDLLRQGLDVKSEVQTSHGRIFYWNTRCGMRELFLTTPELAELAAPSLVCYDPYQVSWAATRLASDEIVVKSNFSMGGRGVASFGPNKPFTLDAIAESFAPARADILGSKQRLSKDTHWAWRHEPFVVECLVGETATNSSITVDCEITPTGEVALVGLSEQLLVGHFHYTGIRSATASSEALSRVKRATLAAGYRLSRYGYRGFFNADFGITKEDAVFICDLNVRRSAPLDVHMLLQRLESLWSNSISNYWSCDAWPVETSTESQLLSEFDKMGVGFDGRNGVLLLSKPFPGHKGENTVAILVLAEDNDQLEGFLHALQHSRR